MSCPVYVNNTYETITDQGTFDLQARGISLNSAVREDSSFDAGFVAVRGGLSLSLVNRRFPGHYYRMLRRE